MLAAVAGLALVAGTGFGATASTQNPTATVAATIALTDPTSLGAVPALCTNTLAPLDTDDCGDVAYTAGNPNGLLRLGSLAGTDVQAGALRWQVTTSNATGYRVYLRNVGAAPLMKSAGGSIADMPAAAPIPASAVDDSTHMGVAVGDGGADNEGAVSYPASPWVTSGGQQGELFAGVPTSNPGLIVAQRTTAQTNDPFTVTFAVASVAGQQPPAGAYAGTVELTASTI